MACYFNQVITVFKEFSKLIDDQQEKQITLRSLFQIRREKYCNPIPIEEVESVSEIVRRFRLELMSFGSILMKHT